MAASTMVSADPLAASHRSGAAASRAATRRPVCDRGQHECKRPHQCKPEQARRPGGGKGRTGLRSAARLWMKSSCRDCVVGGKHGFTPPDRGAPRRLFRARCKFTLRDPRLRPVAAALSASERSCRTSSWTASRCRSGKSATASPSRPRFQRRRRHAGSKPIRRHGSRRQAVRAPRVLPAGRSCAGCRPRAVRQ